MGECRDLKGSAVRSVVLGIRLANATLHNREKIAEETLKSEKVQKAIHEAFRKQAGSLVKASLSGQTLDGAAARSFIGPIGEAARPKALKEVQQQKAYRDAATGLRTLKCSFDSTPVGVFVDKNKTWLIIAGVVVGAGSAVAMYRTRSGDVPAKAMAAITELAAKKIEVGNVTFDVKGLEFVPSKEDAKGTVGVTMGPLEAVHTRFELSAAVKGGKLEELSVSDSLVVPLTDHTKLTAKASVGLRDNSPTYDMALVVKRKHNGFTLDVTAYAAGVGPELTVGAKASAGYQLDTARILGTGSRTTLGATGSLQAKRANGSAPFGSSAAVNVGLTATFW